MAWWGSAERVGSLRSRRCGRLAVVGRQDGPRSLDPVIAASGFNFTLQRSGLYLLVALIRPIGTAIPGTLVPWAKSDESAPLDFSSGHTVTGKCTDDRMSPCDRWVQLSGGLMHGVQQDSVYAALPGGSGLGAGKIDILAQVQLWRDKYVDQTWLALTDDDAATFQISINDAHCFAIQGQLGEVTTIMGKALPSLSTEAIDLERNMLRLIRCLEHLARYKMTKGVIGGTGQGAPDQGAPDQEKTAGAVKVPVGGAIRGNSYEYANRTVKLEL
ncbi:hypothetical protein GGTG_13419 [Gaeumannomyces tritici R3-111a-1]|uniref:Uncharacterized protein n=1 Tax=Gaeumannomyces tritici (strain R3-111a-1) TaxID=644352 RepID=J3PIT9_GAET3|nr:hypothetical protein GGTG_13419 [Gaeumannomyces tritici R3-111a-1]EJT69022.1 hypothetical protein GGTG_13419 [Gaeumannomyces tritici R3-111a-1]